MNYPYFLEDRLKPILYLYDSAAPIYEEIKRKIDSGEAPYDATRHPDDESDEPLFLEEWEQANAALDLLGMSCLGHVQTALHVFLHHFTEGMWGAKALGAVSQMKQKSWLANFRALYATDPSLDWNNSEADLGFIEEMILTRNTSQHGGELYSTYTYQDERHREKFPDSSFGDPNWLGHSVVHGTRLLVTGEHLHQAAEAVRTLARFLDSASRARKQEVWLERRTKSD